MKSTPSEPMFSQIPLGKRLRAWRDFRGLTQADVERRGGLAHNALSRIETGTVSPKLATLERIANALELSVEELHLKLPPAAPSVSSDKADFRRLKQLIEDLPPEKQTGIIEAMCRLIAEVKP